MLMKHLMKYCNKEKTLVTLHTGTYVKEIPLLEKLEQISQTLLRIFRYINIYWVCDNEIPYLKLFLYLIQFDNKKSINHV